MAKWAQLVVAALAAETPAARLRGVTLAQWALESGWGGSRLATEHNNFAGLKWRPEMAGIAQKVRYEAHDRPDDYCSFTTPADFVQGYWRFIGRSVYDGWRDHKENPEGYVRFIASKGYAGVAGYAERVLALAAPMEALIRAFDVVATGQGAAGSGASGSSASVPAEPAKPNPDEPALAPEEARPGRAEIGERVAELIPPSEEPRFKSLAHVNHKFRGARSNGLEGAIIHYDAGRTRPSNGPADPEWGAMRTLEGGQRDGYAFATVSRAGTIYLPTNMDWQKWGSHAGDSKCPRTGRDWVSQYYVGFEVNSPGIVFPTEDPDLYVPWFEAVRDKNNNPILDAKGRAKVAKPNGEHYRKSSLHFVSVDSGNLRKGVYVPYTAEQVKALVNVMLWLKRTFSTFRIDQVFGHDEVAPKRKVDPGGCLMQPAGTGKEGICSMADFRAHLAAAWEEHKKLVS